MALSETALAFDGTCTLVTQCVYFGRAAPFRASVSRVPFQAAVVGKIANNTVNIETVGCEKSLVRAVSGA
ncbi:MAG: hypothetical protein HC862_19725 [Scytonema sp. RU_4_4]|nr:hypothetical protein [Scytonema sp. RU_4_4]